MLQRLKDSGQLLYRHLGGTLLLGGAFALSLHAASRNWQGNVGEMLSWLALQLLGSCHVLRHWDRHPAKDGRQFRYGEIGGVLALLLTVLALAWLPVPEACIYLLLAASVGLYVERLRGLWALFLYAIGLWVIPLHDAWRLWLSYPLRYCATDGCAWLLGWLGLEATVSGTTLVVDQSAIAVTGSCSGVEQLDALLLVTVCLALLLHERWWPRVIQVLFFLPSLLVANILRLVLVVLLARGLGPQAYVGFWHDTLGYVQLLSTLGLLLGVGQALRCCHFSPKKEPDALCVVQTVPPPAETPAPVAETPGRGWWRAGVLVAATLAVSLADFAYLIRTCLDSPNDRYNWLFWGLGFAFVLLTLPRLRREQLRHDWLALIPFALCAVSWMWACGRSLHLGIYLSGVVGLWSLSWLILGWRSATYLGPGVLILMLGCPSVSYLIGAVPQRCLYSLLAVMLMYFLYRYRLHRHDAAFTAAVIVFGILGVGQAQIGALYAPLQLADPVPLTAGQRLVPAARLASDASFFRHSRFWRYYLRLNEKEGVGILYVRSGKAISEIHPAGHCLRSGGAVISHDAVRKVELHGKTYQIKEIECHSQGRSWLYWALYGDATGTSGSFVAFRLRDTQPETRFSLQLNTEIRPGQLPQARQRLLTALRLLSQAD